MGEEDPVEFAARFLFFWAALALRTMTDSFEELEEEEEPRDFLWAWTGWRVLDYEEHALNSAGADTTFRRAGEVFS